MADIGNLAGSERALHGNRNRGAAPFYFLQRYRSRALGRPQSELSNRNLATDFHHLVVGQFEDICYTYGVASHRCKDGFLPTRDPSPALPRYDRFMTDVKNDLVAIDFSAFGPATVEYG